MIRRPLFALLAGLAFAAGCASPPPAPRDVEPQPPQLVSFGEPFETSEGQVFVLRIQDEYRVIRCIPDGPIAGCYEDVLSVPDHSVPWNTWLDVGDVPGLRVAFVSPHAIALHQLPPERPRPIPVPENEPSISIAPELPAAK